MPSLVHYWKAIYLYALRMSLIQTNLPVSTRSLAQSLTLLLSHKTKQVRDGVILYYSKLFSRFRYHFLILLTHF